MTDRKSSAPEAFSQFRAEGEALSGTMDALEARSARFGAALSDALQAAAVHGKGLDDILQGLGRRLTDMALSAAMKPLEGLVSQAAQSLAGSLGSVTAFAKGGVVQSPTGFAMGGGGVGVMGEAGPEAILPLKRGADGSLGVATGGGGQAAGPPIVFNVTTADADSFRKSEGQISAMLARSVARGRRGL
ncbi:phage tail tape measure protein [Rhizobium sp. SSA_523]|uniref:phage tail tape measure protein n=1 Tax=Rhizobium sp. SSA_523 TaxID=2952477 RepID=UPI0020908F5C|nr:phage tail tape measure protein [Rhizobium sp. SSA_523]MCO5730902.1 phage tail tape measure protein [Rhizobium sp. SSA_523]WKC24284.1 phage tail tape measure protein [Rhizobium sp. SSA_523]